ncbi:MAG: hypothetical protein ACOX8H_10610 [Ruminococcus sp.]
MANKTPLFLPLYAGKCMKMILTEANGNGILLQVSRRRQWVPQGRKEYFTRRGEIILIKMRIFMPFCLCGQEGFFVISEACTTKI